LSPDEALLLAGELPHLDALIRAGSPGGDAARSAALGIDRETARVLALGVLNVAQGHPYLLKLANDQAAQPERLAVLVAAGDQAWREQGGLPDGFFAGEATTADPGDYLAVLAAWTRVIAGTLSFGERDLFWFLCCLEEPDRERPAIDAIWPETWDRLRRDGQHPEIDAALSAVAVRGLAAARPGNEYAALSYAIHPGVAEAGRVQAGQPFRDAVDASAASFWDGVHRITSGELDGSVNTGMLLRTGLAAIPYYLRQQDWDAAGVLVYDVFLQDPSRARAVAVLPAMQQVAKHNPRTAGALAQVLRVIDPAAAEATLRAALDDAVTHDDHLAAGVTAALLSDLCLGSERLAEALHLTEQKASHTRQAGLGPWTQIADAGRRLNVLLAMGHAELVLDEAGRLCARMDGLPATPTADDPGIPPWNVREAVFSTSCNAAIELGRWEEALDWNAKDLASRRGRGAPGTQIARARFCGHQPLLELGRIDEALGLLQDCRQVFQEAHDTGMLGKVLSALAEVEDHRGHGESALRLERDALRYAYLAGDLPAIKHGYYYLGNHARRHGLALASSIAFALLYSLIAIRGNAAGSPQHKIPLVEIDLREYGTPADLPHNIADLCDQLADIPGTDLPGLIATLSPAPETAEHILAAVIAHAQIRAAQSPPSRLPLTGTELARNM
jgi:tetratricopeptide (TPR) repeat protein